MSLTNVGRSAIDLPEHDVERADDRRDIGQHMPAAQEIHRLQMGERRRPDLALVRPVAAVRHQVDAELALGRTLEPITAVRSAEMGARTRTIERRGAYISNHHLIENWTRLFYGD